jgi:hypothetical protein
MKQCKLVMVVLSLVMMLPSYATKIFKEKNIKRSTMAMTIDVVYPVVGGVYQKDIDALIQSNLIELNKLVKDSATLPKDMSGKNALIIRYEVPYQNKHVMSLLFHISLMPKGAAHPMNSDVSFNYIDKKNVAIADLMKKDTPYLKAFSTYAKTQLLAKQISDEKWVTEGTSPSNSNYRVFNFHSKGLAVIFNTYQVAPYAFGTQTIVIPQSLLKQYIRPNVITAIWGNA